MKTTTDNNPLIPYASSLITKEVEKTKLPAGVIFSYGCRGCEWKGTAMCQEEYLWQSSKTLPEGICKPRSIYLKGFNRGTKTEPNMTEWEADYNQGTAQKKLQQLLDRTEQFRKEAEKSEQALDNLKDAGIAPDNEDFKRYMKHMTHYQKQHLKSHDEWHRLWKDLRNLQEQRLNREAPKKLEVTHRDAISIPEFQKMMKNADKVIDADYEVIEDDK